MALGRCSTPEIAGPLWVGDKKSLDMRNVHANSAISIEGFSSGGSILVVKKGNSYTYLNWNKSLVVI